MASPPRKLVVLDLNGTLVVRSKAGRGAHVPPPSDPYISFAPGAQAIKVPLPPRIVYSRPFLRPFQQFLTHPSTRAWLDAMVWSSAQPHSIESMVSHAFPGEARNVLCAVWTRKDLGLSEKEYFKKTPTTKDLAKIWKVIPEHSGKSTVLVDDSILKAHLQPFNHLCLPEYTLKARATDLALVAEPAPPGGKKKRNRNKKKKIAGSAPPEADNANDAEALSSRLQAVAVTELKREPPATEVIEPARALDSMSATPSPLDTTTPAEVVHDSVAAGTTDPRAPAGVDAALLAVVGIIYKLKEVEDVAEWFKEGHVARTDGLKAGESESSVQGNIDHGQGMWFHDAGVVRAWVQEGIRVLDELGIEIVHGIEPSGQQPSL
ncbi:uncharacterized protein SCHCODRAFT_02609778 [Schizophyllum commune H4-8]|nr:uncharacterized protein SCHCODRAFT_02609778 [Schizophyllum commune H4-8]KAI5897607.1 hypothetical protein SCHCODRAFT_02609778 [Schizophyllum commune H4-8]